MVAASQSGSSAEIITLADRKSAGFALEVSNTAGSPLASAADGCVLTRAGEESAVSCKTYLAALAWLEPVLFGEPVEERLAQLEAAAPA